MHKPPKEEAEKLIKLFWSHQIYSHCGTIEADKAAKMNAMYAVGEIMKANPCKPREYTDTMGYWDAVMTEIKNYIF